MKHSYSAGAILIGPTNRVAVVSQHGTSWSLAKGTLEKGEDKLTALKREVEEETGITQLEVIRELGTYSRYLIGKTGGEDKTHRKTITLFLCTTDEVKLEPQDPENPEARWVDADKVADLLTHPKDKQFYQEQLQEVRNFISRRD
ncbi:NUDIX domain-containing protein [Candidatus Saccharibacteria bacterium]|nr:NUDIX domain-containing protein [Candidatus Saccharibacteria bacterium]